MRLLFQRWIRSLRRLSRSRKARRRPFHPIIESLERRVVMSTASAYQLLSDPVNAGSWPIGPYSIDAQTGDVSLSHSLDFRQSEISVLQAWNSPGGGAALVYNSAAIDGSSNPNPVIGASFTIDAGLGVPTSIDTAVTANVGNGSHTVSQTFYTTGHSAGDTYFLVSPLLSPIGPPVATGVFTWSMSLTAHFSGSSDLTETISGQKLQLVVNGASSAYGDGWGIAGLDSLQVQNDGSALAIHGAGGSDLYTVDSGASSGTTTVYDSPGYDFGHLVKNNSSGAFTYTATDQTKWGFNSSGQLTEVTDPHGLARVFSYLTDGDISTILEPDGGIATFSYSSGHLSAIAEPGGRTVTVTINGSGDLTNIANPDGTTTTLAYSGSTHLLISDAAGHQTGTIAYDTIGLPTAVTLKDDTGDSSAWGMTPVAAWGQTAGTSIPAGKPTALNTDSATNTTTMVLDSLGRRIELDTPDGFSQTWQRNSAGQVTVATDGLSRKTTYTYDSSTGKVTEIYYADGTNQQFQYDSTFNKLAQIQDQRGNKTTFSYDSTGNLVTITNALNEVTTFTWMDDGASGVSKDLLQSVTDANNKTTTYIYGSESTTYAAYRNRWRVQSVEDALGKFTTFTYNSAGDRITITDALGRTTSLTYDGMRNVLTVTQPPPGGVTSMTYDPQGRVATVTDALGRVTTYTYNNLGDVSISTRPDDPNTYVYDSMDRATVTIDGDGYKTTSVFDGAGNVTEVLDAGGGTTHFSYDALNRLTGTVDALGDKTTYLLDAAGNVTEMIDPLGNITQYEYDALNRVSVVIDAQGHHTTTLFDPVGKVTEVIDRLGHTTKYQYDALNRVTGVTDALGDHTTFARDAVGNVTQVTDALGNTSQYQYDALNVATVTIDALGHHTTSLVDAVGNVTQVTDARGYSRKYQYDVLNRATVMTDALNNSTTISYDLFGNLTLATDALNRVTTFLYDSANLLTETIDARGDTTTVLYDALGHATEVIDANGHATQYLRDSLGRVTETINAVGDWRATYYDAAGHVTGSSDNGNLTQYVYDSLGRASVTIDRLGNHTTLLFDAAGNVTEMLDASGHARTFQYDALNRVTGTTDAFGHATYQYDALGHVTAVTDGNGHTTTYEYDALGRQTVSIDARGYSTTTVYDAVGDVTAIIDPDGNTTTFLYDAVDRQTAMIDVTNGGAHTETYAYDAVGNLTSLTDRDARVQKFAYDALNRLTLSTWLNNSGTTVNLLTYVYDHVGNVTMAANLNGAYTMTYDAANQATVVQEPFGQTLTFTYDGAGNRTTMVDSQAGLTSYVYDANNNLMAVLAGYGGAGEGGSPATLAVTFAYTPTNQVSEIRRYIDVSGISDVWDVEALRAGTWTGGSTAIANTSYTYDAAERVTNIVHRSGQTSTFTNLAYSYDAGDRVTQLVQDGVTTTYGYDAANQLLSDGTSTFTYDHNGNRNMTGYVTAAGNEVTNDGTWTYSYDNEGNVTGKSNSTYSWGFSYDNQNHLTEAKEYVLSTDLIQVDETYKYDAFGNRIETDVQTYTSGGSLDSSTVTRFAYDGWKVKQDAVGNRPTFVGNENWDVWAQLDGSNTLQVRYVYGTGVDQLLGRDDSDVAFYLTDRLGSVRVVVDNLGNFQDLLYYNGFGGLITETNASFSDQYKYVSREIDAYSGLIYDRARWYDPATGRFMSQDPMGFLAGDANLYRYVGNSPTNATDPSGKYVVVGPDQVGAFLQWMAKNGFTMAQGFRLLPYGNGYVLDVPDPTPPGWDQFAFKNGLDGNVVWGTRFNKVCIAPLSLTYKQKVGLINIVAAADGLPGVKEQDTDFTFWDGLHAFGEGLKDGAQMELIGAGKSLGIEIIDPATEQRLRQEYGDGVVDLSSGCGYVATEAIKQATRQALQQAANLLQCFPADTPVATEDGLRPIQHIKRGERVWAYDLVARQWVLRRVLNTFEMPHEGTLATISIGGEDIEATGRHPFWVVEGERLQDRPRLKHLPEKPAAAVVPGRWVDAIDLRVGDMLLLKGGRRLAVTGLAVESARLKVYNLEVEDLHCYAVGKTQALVHNNNGADDAGNVNPNPEQTAAAAQDLQKEIDAWGKVKEGALAAGQWGDADHADTQIQMLQNQLNKLFNMPQNPWKGG